MSDREPGSVFSDGTIRRLVGEGRIVIDPWDASLVQPASVDVKLGRSFRVFHNHRASAIDLRDPPQNLTELLEMEEDEPFVIHPGEFCLATTLERVELPDDIVARIEGKALALDTPIPTPQGWRTMGELEPGDEVFDHRGWPTPILSATEPMVGRPCREVVFSDRTTIVADASHSWAVRTKVDRAAHRSGPGRVLSTEEIRASLRCGREWNHHVVQAAPVQYQEKELVIPPYVLGVWIGDGTSTKAEITTIDERILQEIEREGCGAATKASSPLAYRIGGVGHTRDPATGRYTRNDSISSRLRTVGVMGNKHIPRAYLEASEAQRWALLEGLMDTDGYADRWGRCELTTVSPLLAEQYHELIASLGLRPVIARKTAWLNGRDCGPKYDVTFTPHLPVFRLSRKLARQKLFEGWHQFNRGIVDVRTVKSVPVRCIQVARSEGLFLASRAFIPTHNSSLGRLGLIVHATAGFCDPGWKGALTLELNNLTRIPIKLWPGMLIAQLSFMALDAPAQRPYGSAELGSHYQGQAAATESRYEGARGRPGVR